jgi:molecular chaperone GrpE (heat shock protein)
MDNVRDLRAHFEETIRKYEHAVQYFLWLKQRQTELEKENATLKETNKTLQRDLKQLQKNQGSVAEDFQNSKKLANVVIDKLKETSSEAELKKILDEYIRGIERCIAFLNQ